MELGAIGDPVVVHVDTHVREDHIHLFGFVVEDERAWFQLLQTVQGVGAKAALAILSALSTDEVSGPIFAQDKASLCRAEGVGPRLADRILNELKDKAPKLLGSLTQSSQPLQPSTDPMFTDAVSAMINLGYSRLDAHKTVTNVRKKGIDNETLDQIISASLKELSS
jgi:Holliday junction DNA helicase RuvA